jgi:2-keto-4-pentenoate hydratase/2-oxohepta-3-ene-1,7-dioic acid hydratase in catechol pathway
VLRRIFENISYYENHCNQKSDTSFLIFLDSAADQLRLRDLRLAPGDVIATGTPAGVGFTRKPPTFLAPGDIVRSQGGKRSALRNPVVDEAAH